jgi:hypothetical protein
MPLEGSLAVRLFQLGIIRVVGYIQNVVQTPHTKIYAVLFIAQGFWRKLENAMLHDRYTISRTPSLPRAHA